MLSQEENEETSDDEWDELLFEIDEESYWNKKLGKLLIITQIPLHLKVLCFLVELNQFKYCRFCRHELINWSGSNAIFDLRQEEVAEENRDRPQHS